MRVKNKELNKNIRSLIEFLQCFDVWNFRYFRHEQYITILLKKLSSILYSWFTFNNFHYLLQIGVYHETYLILDLKLIYI